MTQRYLLYLNLLHEGVDADQSPAQEEAQIQGTLAQPAIKVSQLGL